MKEFLVGLIFILGVLALSGLGLVLYPFLLLLGFALRIFIIIGLGIFFIWLLGKFIIFVWESLKNKPKP
ncbi:MAG: hypothetical protein K9L87_05485 [Candidatus Omnitrophica bacterium]|nr:hypothetical protein [Candidatus Omnitrophota bacterium]MCF7891805.1 hypothetical protein [Candidatus Omnitrophota bacterium]MCF7898182.1 hypothetical protein [Candidatus Omnitrophota bacterium]MCF7909168.1 hypothetical protein [Candidatus Omnitrophota bacterium]